MILCGSLGQSKLDKQPILVEGSWDDLCDLWIDYAAIRRHPTAKNGVLIDPSDERSKFRIWPSTPFLSPFLLAANAPSKAREYVIGFGAWFGLDVDVGWTMTSLTERLEGFQYFIHTTTSSTDDTPHLRVMITLSRELVTEDEYYAVWRFLDQHLLDDCLDQSTKNWNRLLYVPALWDGADNHWVCQRGGARFDVDMMLDEAPIPPPTTLRTGTTVICTALGGLVDYPHCGMITAKMMRSYREETPGGRFWRLLLRMGMRAKWFGWKVTAKQVAHEALIFDRNAAGKVRDGAEREAQRALAIADVNGTTNEAVAQATHATAELITRIDQLNQKRGDQPRQIQGENNNGFHPISNTFRRRTH